MLQRQVIFLSMLVVAQAVALTYVAANLSATPDEYPNLVAGLTYLENGRFELFCVNPPLLKVLAAVPSYFAGFEAPHFRIEPDRPEFDAGIQFAIENGLDAEAALFSARVVNITFTLLGTVSVFLLGKLLINIRCGMVAAVLWAFSPLTLAYGPLLSFDVPASAAGALAIYMLLDWMRRKTWTNAFAAGATLAFAILIKTTWIFLMILIPILATVFAIRTRSDSRDEKESQQVWLRLNLTCCSQLLVAILGCCLLLINLGYRFQGSGTRLGDYRFQSKMLTALEFNGTAVRNRFESNIIGLLPIPFPRPFIEGIDVQKSDFEVQRPAYRLGSRRDHGTWYYYLLGYAVKLPLAMLAGLLVGIAAITVSRSENANLARAALIVLPACLIALVSSQTGMNDHFRYGLIAMANLCVLSAAGLTVLFDSTIRLHRLLATIALPGVVLAPVQCFPYCHPYLNECTRLISAPGEVLGGSAPDWHQGWKAAREWICINRASKDIWQYRSRWSDPAFHHIAVRTKDAQSARRVANGNGPKEKDVWLLISIADKQRLDREQKSMLIDPAETVGGGVEVFEIPVEALEFLGTANLLRID